MTNGKVQHYNRHIAAHLRSQEWNGGFLLALELRRGVIEARRAVVFIDWQNCYESALEAFPSGSVGNVVPLRLATRLATRAVTGAKIGRELARVKVYRGLASPFKDKRTNAAAQRQHEAWKRVRPDLVEVHTRPLAYRKETIRTPLGEQVEKEVAREKGVDIQLAIDLLRDTLFDGSDRCDTAILFSQDTDFYPALELLISRRGKDAIELARWCGDRNHPPDPPIIGGVKMRQHLLDYSFYQSIEDRTSYDQKL